jgi:transcriptional regulator with XRE-family HTH domain
MPRAKKNGLRQVVAANVRHFRLLSGMTQEELAHKVGISVPYMSQIENGVANCSLDIVEAIAAALALSPASLVAPAT